MNQFILATTEFHNQQNYNMNFYSFQTDRKFLLCIAIGWEIALAKKEKWLTLNSAIVYM